MVFHHPDGLPGARQTQHHFDEIAARRPQAARPEDAGRAHDQRRVQVSLRVEFAGQLRDAVGAQWMRGVAFDIRPSGRAVEDVIG